MARQKKETTVEIVPRGQSGIVPKAPTVNIEAILDRMVRERVDEILATRAAEKVEADFQPRDVANDTRIRNNVFELRKWALYFEQWGCRMCRRRNVSHASGGHCDRCNNLVAGRLGRIKRKFYEDDPDLEIERQINQITSRMRSAQALLTDREE